MKKPKIAVAYSGGLDTSVIVKWLQEKYNADVITVTGNLGQKKEIVGLADKAYKSGAKKVFIQDLRREFVEEYLWRTLKAGALYEHTYPMATSIGRPLLAKALVEVAKRERCTHVAHGCTGKGNDQVRFEVAVAALAPDIKVLAPLREWEFKSREEEIEYCQKHGIPVAATKASPYSVDENIWGTSIECGILEDPMAEPPEDAYQRTVSPKDAPDKPTYVTIEFREGVPVGVNGKRMDGVSLLDQLNEVAGSNGVGRLDLVENRLVGIKSREVYEAPGATVLHFAHRELERLTLDKETSHYKAKLAHDYADLVYNGLWFSPLRVAIDGFVDQTQKVVNGLVKVKLYKGNLEISGRTSPNSLYDTKLATYTDEDKFDHKASVGFITIYGLPVKTFYRVNRDLLKAKRKLVRKKR
ncbi:MAG: argininosuccinate synthase [Ignavibacteria bacterium GWA2_55_11]|nr:MAG: argininosuccinate synthase [Ignavibacteria bacterium GWA2_55_11]OGU44329.1 MAG: argininosuccinate synthase [Ignavibacteria bacterium GWC2_56_12]OGU64246.1 MAG: argininosuccinate synthase [Ignavibacteria bacterium RIFCSPHIGHO2_02_FULL_56_12]OGU76452.1 MAG: argininosuccinate synthase [Ignavibacteria bacterium RIFCSPLOWO2_12_FULL_56_21]HAV23220.1 argininosuccinate synthase [Bacteroidota bacterium]